MKITYTKEESGSTSAFTPKEESAPTSTINPVNDEIQVGTSTAQSESLTPTSTVAGNSPPLSESAVSHSPQKPLTTSVPEPKPTASATEQISNTNSRLKWGVFAGSNPTVIKDFEQKVDQNPDYLAYFVHWGNDNGKLPSYLKSLAYEKNRTLVLFWEASDYKIGGTDQPSYSYRSILDGTWDSYFTDFAQQLKLYKGPVILVPFSELNGNWTPWSGTKNGNTPQDAVLAWKYVHGFFDTVPNVSFGLAVNAASVPNTAENQISAYYPGDEYVDYVGVDGFNMGDPWASFHTIFSPALSTLSKYNKPMLIFSFASAQGTQKASWLDDALNVQLPKYPLVQGWVYFNQNKERNWLLWSDTTTFDVFSAYIKK